MNQEDITASVLVELLAANNKEKLHMNISTLDRELKSSIVDAGSNGVLTPEEAKEFINNLGYRSI